MSDVRPSSHWTVPQVDILQRDRRAFHRDLTAALKFGMHHPYYEAPLYAVYKTLLQEFDIRIGNASNFAVVSSPQYQLLFKGDDVGSEGKNSRRHPDFGTVIFDDTPNPRLLFLSEVKRLHFPGVEWFDADSPAYEEVTSNIVRRGDITTQLRGQAKYAFKQFPNQRRVFIFLFIGPYYYLYTFSRDRTSPIARKAPRASQTRAEGSRKRRRRGVYDSDDDGDDGDDVEKDPSYKDSDEEDEEEPVEESHGDPTAPIQMNLALEFNNGIATLSADFVQSVTYILKVLNDEQDVVFPFDDLQNVAWFPLM
ncbi:hypothetical protein FISHEDRAFT_78981 [Fistulina hepatica ATCC 64428]|uniref:Uncharacterized protein n=1 Tax=Fistulina hepatica ATCC 64428 TaxID=1128425 RepID=A0A0D6ZZE7_9AGAR|nr:hypothetical protein FISHEDRAFT_78981 [Fistulina hepatica ATCC 64428]